MDLSSAERARVAAHLTWLLRAPPSAAAVKKRLAEVPASGREALASFLVGVAGADGHIDPAEIKLLQKLYPLLGFGAELVFKHIHAMSADAAVPRGSLPPARGSAPPRASGVDLDMSRVQATLAQTASVSSLLGSIFADEPETPAAPPPATRSVAGLDDPHAALFEALTGRTGWSRGDFEALCARWSLMPDGALEVLNERAFDLAGAPLCEGDDPIAVDPAIAKEMKDA